MKKEDLKKIYQVVCSEYAQTLCDNYEWDYKDCFWVSDDIGGTFCTDDIEFSLDMNDVRLLVDNDVDYEIFIKWWDYNMAMHEAMRNHPEEPDYHLISLYSWLKGYRGPRTIEELEKDNRMWCELKKQPKNND